MVALTGHADRVLAAAFSPDGTRVVTASADRTARVWDAATGAVIAVLAGHTDGVNAAAFSSEGSRIVTASADRTARIWQLDPLVLMPADQRQSYVCRERLIGARSFTAREIEEAMLRGRDDLRHPCDRVGPFSLGYYRQAAARAGTALRHAFSH
jgi:predicted oxidoreductase (fatty acid repression mutant protein)